MSSQGGDGHDGHEGHEHGESDEASRAWVHVPSMPDPITSHASLRDMDRGALFTNGDETALPAVLVVTIGWVIALVVLLFQRSTLVEQDRGWWLWVAAAGTLTGVLALAYLWRRANRRQLLRPGQE